MGISPTKGILRSSIVLAVCLLAAGFWSQPVSSNNIILSGTTITVNTTADELNTDGDCSLREALQAANNNIAVDKCAAGIGADMIVLMPGTYKLTKLGVDEDLGITGDLDIYEDVSIGGANLNSTIIDGNGSDRVFHVYDQDGEDETGVNVKFANLTIQNGYAPDGIYGGGAILNGHQALPSGTFQVINCLFYQNRAVNTGGGIDNSGTALLIDVTFSSNHADAGGGVFNGGTLNIEGATFIQNTASATGGGIDNNSSATLQNVTLSANTGLHGGGLSNDGTIFIFNLTITGNNSGIYNNQGQLRIKNTIVANSTVDDNCYTYGGSWTSLGYNLDSGNTCLFTSASDQINTDPLLGVLQDNLGPTLTHALLDGSPAIDKGDNDYCPLADQRGAYRPADGDENGSSVCDIGAFELGGEFPYYTFLPTLFRH